MLADNIVSILKFCQTAAGLDVSQPEATIFSALHDSFIEQLQ